MRRASALRFFRGMLMKITCLSENTSVDSSLIAEHGLSLLIETGEKNILFDMGQTDAFARNADKLGVDLANVDFAVLSHGHYDHGGGAAEFMRRNSKAKIYINSAAFGEHFNGTQKYIGLDKSLVKSSRLVLCHSDISLGSDIKICRCDKLICPIDSAGLNVLSDGDFVPDCFEHEHYLMITENSKRYLFSGCSHKGVINIQDYFKPDIFIGGFHLSKLSAETDSDRLSAIANKLCAYDTVFYTAHCTGREQFDFLKNNMSEKLYYISAGTVTEI